jgi:hypothetical protein
LTTFVEIKNSKYSTIFLFAFPRNSRLVKGSKNHFPSPGFEPSQLLNGN